MYVCVDIFLFLFLFKALPVGVDVPDAYIDVYAQCSPRQESVSLEKVLTVIGLYGLTNEVQEKVSFCFIRLHKRLLTQIPDHELNYCS